MVSITLEIVSNRYLLIGNNLASLCGRLQKQRHTTLVDPPDQSGKRGYRGREREFVGSKHSVQKSVSEIWLV